MSHEPIEEGKKLYEISFWVKAQPVQKEIVTVLKSHGAESLKESHCEERRLAYPIKKLSIAHFGVIQFVAPASAMPTLDAVVRGMKEVLRFLIVLKEEEEAPRAMPGTEAPKEEKVVSTAAPREVVTPTEKSEISNKDLEDKLEEMLK